MIFLTLCCNTIYLCPLSRKLHKEFALRETFLYVESRGLGKSEHFLEVSIMSSPGGNCEFGTNYGEKRGEYSRKLRTKEIRF